jgi:hypothetical protein
MITKDGAMRLLRTRHFVTRMLTIAGLIAGACAVAGGLQGARNRLVVENHSAQSIVLLEISIRSIPVATFRNLPDGGQGSASFRITGDSSFDLSGTLADGTRVGGNFGYFTTGSYGEHPRFIVRGAGQLEFTQ